MEQKKLWLVSGLVLLILISVVVTGWIFFIGKGPVNETDRAIGIALNDSVVTASLTSRWAIKEVNPDAESTVFRYGKYVTLRTPNVVIETESGMVNVYVDLDTRSVVNIYEAPKQEPMPGYYPEPMLSGVSSVSLNESLPELIVNYSEIAYIGIQDPSDPVDENRKNIVAQAAVADERVRAILLDGGIIEGVILQCHPTPKDSGGSACALALRVLHKGSNWDFLMDEKSGEVIFVQREVLPGRI